VVERRRALVVADLDQRGVFGEHLAYAIRLAALDGPEELFAGIGR
jgi:hypothetical protein